MPELNSFKECREYLDKGKRKLKTMDRPIATNTRVEQLDDGTIGIKLHQTYIIKYYSNLLCGKFYGDLKGDSIQLNTGGWKTPLTRDRFDRFCPLNVWTTQNVMYVSKDNWYRIHKKKEKGIKSRVYHFVDRMWFNPNGTVWVKENSEPVKLNPYNKKEEQAKRKQLKSIDTFIRNYLNKLTSGQMDHPGAGDCFICQFEAGSENIEVGQMDKSGNVTPGSNPDHLLNHMREKYYVPSIVWNAIRSECYDSEGIWGNPKMISGLSQFDKHNISCWFNPDSEHKPMANDLTTQRVRKIMKTYFIKRLGV